MFDNLLIFLKDPANRAVLAWVGGGIAAVAAAAWAVVKFFAKKPAIAATNSSVAIGGNSTNSPVNINSRSSDKR